MTIGLGNFKVIDELCKNISECYVAGATIQWIDLLHYEVLDVFSIF